MPLITHDTDNVPGANDKPALAARVSELADHLAKLDGHLAKLSSVNPGPPSDQTLVANLQRIVATANHVATAAGNWMQGGQANTPPVP